MISESAEKKLRGMLLIAIIILAVILPNTCSFASEMDHTTDSYPRIMELMLF